MFLGNLSVLLDGFVGVLSMFSIMWLITNSGLANCNMVGAIGSMLTKDRQKENLYGFTVYLFGGLFFAFLYNYIFLATKIPSMNFMLFMSLFLGFIHGLVVSYAIIAVFSHQHKDERFKDVSIGIALAHLFAHMLFGLTLGLMFCMRSGLLNPNFSFHKNPMAVYTFFAITALPVLMSIFSIDRKIHKPVEEKEG